MPKVRTEEQLEVSDDEEQDEERGEKTKKDQGGQLRKK